jgi:hypothetical protein
MLRPIHFIAPGLLAGALFSLPGCLFPIPQHAYYVSPLNGNNETYHPLPLREDSAHTAFYANANFFAGSANEQGTDYFNGGRLSLSAAHHFDMLQFYYGVDGTLGSYHLGHWHDGYTGPLIGGYPTSAPRNANILNSYSGPRTFGCAGFQAGINGVIPVRQGEWRFLGLETSLNREFGDYLSFRKNLADSLASLNIRNPFFTSLGLTSEVVGRTRHGEFGIRLAKGWVLGSAYQRSNVFDDLSAHYLRYNYFNGSFHYTYDRYTGYFQVDGGTKGSSIQVGLQFRLNKPRLPAKEEGHRHRG